jgi:hypothetical protein
VVSVFYLKITPSSADASFYTDKIHLEISHSKSLTVLKAVHRQALEVRSFSNVRFPFFLFFT